MPGRLLSLADDRRAVSAIEFALCAPLFILLLLCGADLIRYYVIRGQVDAIANTVAELISEHPTGNVVYKDVQFYHDSAMLTFPGLLDAAYKKKVYWDATISLSMASVDFGDPQPGCGGACAYVPRMVWSGGTVPRSCVVPMIPTSDRSDPSPATLPAHVYGPGSIVVVDVVYPFKPLFQARILPAFDIKRSYYIAPRFTPLITYKVVNGDNGIASPCPGYG